ncbi:MAG: hypothetical protein DI584_12480 [Stenotrophomonas sp.]|jgi:DNA (cytosine-5)-methyltransferase 1|nr:MAG: hypothetical protein DI584_12480 [Stenotrophomonas sp.]
MINPKFVSLFSGCGGFDVGFVQAGYEPVAAFDHWPAAVDNYRANVGDHCETQDLSRGSIPYKGQCDVLLSGSPCQGFSTVGRRVFNDPRNSLIGAAVEVAANLKPKLVVIENVPGVRYGKHLAYWVEAIRGLESLGYCVQQIALNAEDYGIPQARRRVMLIANKGRVAPKLVFEKRERVSLGQVLENVEHCENHYPRLLSAETSDGKISRRIGIGQKLCDVRSGENSIHTWQISEVFGKTSLSERMLLEKVLVLRRRNRIRDFGDADPVPIEVLARELGRKLVSVEKTVSSLESKCFVRVYEGLVDLKYAFNGKYRRLDPSLGAHTVHTQFGEPRYFLHPHEHRGFTVRESARIQGFPDDYVFKGALRDQYKMIGNAVPPPLGYAVAMSLRTLILEGEV